MGKEIHVLRELTHSDELMSLKLEVENMKTNREVPGSGKVQNSAFELA